MQTGSVKWFNAQKGYGFIAPADGGFNVLVLLSAVERAGLPELKDGQKVAFEIVADERTGEKLAVNLSPFIESPIEQSGSADDAGGRWPGVRKLLVGLKGFGLDS